MPEEAPAPATQAAQTAEVKGPPLITFSFWGLPVGSVDTGSFMYKGVRAEATFAEHSARALSPPLVHLLFPASSCCQHCSAFLTWSV